MSAGQPVDVLAVLDSLIEYHDTSDSLKGRNCIAARAAMAELITKADNAEKALRNLSNANQIDAGYLAYADDLRAALANIGPQP